MCWQMWWIVSERNTCSDRFVLHCGQYGAAHSTPTGSFTNACKLLVHFQSLHACHHSWFQINPCMLATHSSFSNPNKRACNRSQCTGSYVHLIGFIQEIHRSTFTRCFLIVWSRMAMSKKQSLFFIVKDAKNFRWWWDGHVLFVHKCHDFCFWQPVGGALFLQGITSFQSIHPDGLAVVLYSRKGRISWQQSAEWSECCKNLMTRETVFSNKWAWCWLHISCNLSYGSSLIWASWHLHMWVAGCSPVILLDM